MYLSLKYENVKSIFNNPIFLIILFLTFLFFDFNFSFSIINLNELNFFSYINLNKDFI